MLTGMEFVGDSIAVCVDGDGGGDWVGDVMRVVICDGVVGDCEVADVVLLCCVVDDDDIDWALELGMKAVDSSDDEDLIRPG